MSVSNESQAAVVRQMIVDLLPPGSGEEIRIFGAGGVLDSLGLVNLLADLEYRIGETCGREVVLASDRAMSRGRSPFRDVAALTTYIVELLGE